MDRPDQTVPAWILYSLVAISCAMLALAGVGWLYVQSSVETSEQRLNEAIRESARKWCGVVTTLDDGYNRQETKPTTAIGQQIASEIHQLRVEYGCK